MSTTMGKVKELGITKGTLYHIEGSASLLLENGPYESHYKNTVADFFDPTGGGCANNNARLYMDAHNTAQKSGCLPSELLEQRDEAMERSWRVIYDLIGEQRDIGEIAKSLNVDDWTARHLVELAAFLTRIKQGQP